MTETINLPLELRSADDDSRTAVMLVCRYGETSTRTPRPERFAVGAFTRSVTTRGTGIPFTDQHTSGSGEFKAPYVARVRRGCGWDTSDPAELRAAIRFYDTPRGWDAYEAARDGVTDCGSVGFVAVEERTVDGVREITEAELHHVALLSRADGVVPAYDAPGLVEVRQVLPDVTALLAIRYDPAIADGCVSQETLDKIGAGG